MKTVRDITVARENLAEVSDLPALLRSKRAVLLTVRAYHPVLAVQSRARTRATPPREDVHHEPHKPKHRSLLSTDGLARCPAHEDRSPSLSIRERDDGMVLINCFAGCGAIDILDALGLQWSALFPINSDRAPQSSPTHSRIPARDLLEIVSQQVSVVAVVAADMLARKRISEKDWERLAEAAAQIGKARDHIR